MLGIIDCIGCNTKLRVPLDRGTVILTCRCQLRMGFIVVEKLNGIDSSAELILFNPMKKCSNEDRLAVALYMMSDILISKEKYDNLASEDQEKYRNNHPNYIDKIEENLKKIFPPNLKDNRTIHEYSDFQASAIRHIFNRETRNSVEGQVERLWENLKPRTGLWRNTDFGNQHAVNILREQNVIVYKVIPQYESDYRQEKAQHNQQEKAQREQQRTESSVEDHWYDVLRNPNTYNAEQIQAAYRGLISRYHPDRFEMAGQKIKDLSHIETQKINAAYNAAIAACQDANT